MKDALISVDDTFVMLGVRDKSASLKQEDLSTIHHIWQIFYLTISLLSTESLPQENQRVELDGRLLEYPNGVSEGLKGTLWWGVGF